MKILVVEDEQRIASFVEKGLREQGWSVEVCRDGDEAWKSAASKTYDAIVLDVMLPGRDGLSILRQLRKDGHTVPTILLTARSGLDERVEGLNAGADDYLAKPFYVEELVARILAVTRRAAGREINLLRIGELSLNLIAREAKIGESKVELTTREFNLLEYLMRSPGRVFSRTQILERVWDIHFDPNTNIVDVYIQRLRKKLSEVGDGPAIETVRGVGYSIKAE